MRDKKLKTVFKTGYYFDKLFSLERGDVLSVDNDVKITKVSAQGGYQCEKCICSNYCKETKPYPTPCGDNERFRFFRPVHYRMIKTIQPSTSRLSQLI